ncbi:hypothetical protein H257_17327 [Aphanomyces astaci]|uniref:CWH43-like N-terminal domain-containing protein n=1 Tax=Aphanomyces astaci TaxID=112090 RepID=W4FHG0_APHAT|nr:hypothetical protein H257_17327 [Aphanomyces astaci]ETV66178.1 hypothetical protein H257_17327 [Aphanomyces astaci]|eukprot:XP_009844367.1 hypothetical protein H257_17327 [Aphanomyces astaci]
MGSSADVLRRWSPILAPFFTVTTLIICIVITKTKDIYVGSLAWPYFSDMGRDDPAYYVFATGLCLTAIFLALTWTFNFRHQATVLAHPEAKATPSLLRCSFAASTMGAVATIGLPILSIYRVSYDHPEIHNYAAYFFFVFQAAAVFLNTYVTRRILHTSPTPKIFRTTWRIQVVFASLFLIAFILYIPVGLAIVCPFERLTVVKVCSHCFQSTTLTRVWGGSASQKAWGRTTAQRPSASTRPIPNCTTTATAAPSTNFAPPRSWCAFSRWWGTRCPSQHTRTTTPSQPFSPHHLRRTCNGRG